MGSSTPLRALGIAVAIIGCNALTGIGDLEIATSPAPSRRDAGKTSTTSPDASTTSRRDGGEMIPPDDGINVFTFKPSHVASTFSLDVDDVENLATIDTTALTVTSASGDAIANLDFTADANQIAVLRIGRWRQRDRLNVVGGRRLAVLAAGPVEIDAEVDGSARGIIAGPGGAGLGAGAGKGGDGGKGTSNTGGGGGAGFGTAGAKGGEAGSGVDLVGGAPGEAHGADIAIFFGGSAGGKGGEPCTNAARGGSGGGAIQISSRSKIEITESITVGGGGGEGGCAGSAAGGGGSGGTIFLEAPSIDVDGDLSANGGGGGAGASGTTAGANGADGNTVGAAAPGVASGDGAGGSGGVGGAGDKPPGEGQRGNFNGGGGGGAVGRIWIRSKTPAQITATISPAPTLDTSLR